MPPAAIWQEFPNIAVIVLVLALIGGGFYTFARWVWMEYCVERDKDREWREEQNSAREDALKIQNSAWQDTIKELAARWEQQDREREGTLKAIAEATTKMLDKLDRHDERAARIEENTKPLPPRRRSS
jgi:hypothetical protein